MDRAESASLRRRLQALLPGDCVELGRTQRLQCLGGEVAGSSERDEQPQSVTFVFRAQNKETIVSADRPVLGLDGDAGLGCGISKVLSTSSGLLDCFGALLSEAKQTNISFHGIVLIWLTLVAVRALKDLCH